MTPISTTSSVEISIKDIHILNTPCEGTHPYLIFQKQVYKTLFQKLEKYDEKSVACFFLL